MDTFKIAGIVGRVLAAIFGLLGIIGFGIMLGTGIDKDALVELEKLGTPEAQEQIKSLSSSVNFFLTVALWALILAGIAIVGFIFYTAALNWKKLIKPLIFIAGGGIVFLITYSMARGRETYALEGKSVETVETIRAVPDQAFYVADAGLLALYIIMALTVMLVLYTEVSRLFK